MKNYELKELKKCFKLDKGETFDLKAVNNVYFKKSSSGFNKIFSRNENIGLLDKGIIEKYYEIGSKLLTGNISDKIIPLGFKKDALGNQSQIVLCDLMDEDTFEDESNSLADKIIKKVSFSSDIVISMLLGNAYILQKTPGEKVRKGSEMYTNHNFVLAFITEVVLTKEEMTIDTSTKGVRLEPSAIILNSKKPIEGFMFPGIVDWNSDVNEVLYLANKKGVVNNVFVEEILACERELTLTEEKEILNTIFTSSANKLSFSQMTELINEFNELTDDVKASDLADILTKKGISDAKDIMLDNGVKLNSLIKKDGLCLSGSKPVKIKNSKISLAVELDGLVDIKEIVDGTKKYLQIPIDDNLNLNDVLLKK